MNGRSKFEDKIEIRESAVQFDSEIVSVPKDSYLREFVALHYERHPESMRTVPLLRPAGHDSVSVDVRGRFQNR